MGTIKVLTVDDEGLYRDLLLRALSSEERVEVVGEARNGTEAIQLAEELEPDVVLMDIELGSEPNGVEAAHRIKELRPAVGIVILSQHLDRQYIASLPSGKAAGWSYLLKQRVSDVSSLTRAIRGAASGMVFLDVALLEGLKPRPNTKVQGLTQRQRQILALMAQGYSDEEIARDLAIDKRSVGDQIDRILEHLEIAREGQVHPRVKAVLAILDETLVA